MLISNLKLTNFRNLKSINLSFDKGVTVIYGKNGQGKTNLIEAIYLLSTPHSFRAALNNEFVQWGETRTEIEAEVVDKLGKTKLFLAFENKKRELSQNDNKIKSLSDFIGALTTVCFSPSDVSLVKGSESHRRQFIDKHLVDIKPALLKALGSYHRALRNKNKILVEDNIERKLLTPWNHVMAKEGIEVQRAKYKFIERLSSYAASIYSDFSNDGCKLSISLKSDITEAHTSEDFFAELERFATKEIAKRGSAYGIHKDRLLLTLDGKDAKAFASQGQSRSIALALKLAVVSIVTEERKESPVVLLDDIRSELDEERFSNLFEMVLKLNAQVILTTTEVEDEVKNRMKEAGFYRLERGVVNIANQLK